MTNSISRIITGVQYAFTVLLYFVAIIILLDRAQNIIGPSIFADESAYLRLIISFANGIRFAPWQYMPFYPWLSSLITDPNNIILSYDKIRIFGAIIFAASIFPISRIFSMAGIQNFFASLAAFAVVLGPWSSMSYFIWAEPLFYFIFSLCWYLIYRFWKSPTLWRAAQLGIALGFLFITKQAGAMILGIAILITLVFRVIKEKGNLSFYLKSIFAIGFLFFAIAYLTFILTNSDDTIGYSQATGAIGQNILNLLTNINVYKSFFYQLSYIVTGTYFIFSFGIVSFFINRKKINPADFSFFTTLLLTTIGISITIAAFNNSMVTAYNSIDLPEFQTGRYLTPLLPSWIALGWLGLKVFDTKDRKRNLQFIFGTFSLLMVFFLFSPLRSTWSLGYANSPDVMYLAKLVGQNISWDQDYANKLADNFSLQLTLIGFFIALFLMYLFRKGFVKIFLFLFICASYYAGLMSTQCVFTLSGIAKNQNLIYRTILEKKIPIDSILLAEDNILSPHMSDFWFQQDLISRMLTNKKQKSDFDYIISTKEYPSEYQNIIEPGQLKLYKVPPEKN